MSDDHTPLERAALAPYLRDLQGECWWCGSVADSLEHRHKRTDLLRLWVGDEGPVWGGGDEGKMEAIRGPNSRSSAVRFGRVLCQRCNNDQSQPFDLAYDRFSEALVGGMDHWWTETGVDLEAIYGDSWRIDAANLARYYVKNFGCLLADQGIRPPAPMRAFLNGAAAMVDVGLYLVKSESHYIGHRDYLRRFGPNASLWRPPDLAWASPNKGRVTGYEGSTLIGYVGVMMRWNEGSGTQDSFFSHPYPILNPLPADPALREELEELSRERRPAQGEGLGSHPDE